MSKIEIGKKAPPFTLEGTGGTWSLGDAKGASVIIYFYPRDNTSGCTQEGLDFAALNAQFKKSKAVVLGISPDSVASLAATRSTASSWIAISSANSLNMPTVCGVLRRAGRGSIAQRVPKKVPSESTIGIEM